MFNKFHSVHARLSVDEREVMLDVSIITSLALKKVGDLYVGLRARGGQVNTFAENLTFRYARFSSKDSSVYRIYFVFQRRIKIQWRRREIEFYEKRFIVAENFF